MEEKVKGGLANLSKWLCTGCGYIYDPAMGDPKRNIPPGVGFTDLPDDWTCPDCGAPKDMFVEKTLKS